MRAEAVAKPTQDAEFLLALRRALERVADGDWEATLETGGAGELAPVAAAFDAMRDRLRETVRSLELAVQNLHDKQRELVESEKLASLGRVAAGVAHEINNPLAVMSEKAGLLQDLLVLRDDPPARGEYLALVEGVLGQVKRCRSITHRLLGYARRHELAIEAVDVNALVHEAVEYLRLPIAERRVGVEIEPARDLPPAWTDRVQLEEVLVNLLRNAVQAAPAPGGRVAVATAAGAGGTIEVAVRDDGPGIATEHLPRIFEPFFTTKGRGKGTGLGLFISHGIMRRLGGAIAVESEPGRGATFRVRVPLRSCAPGGAAEAAG